MIAEDVSIYVGTSTDVEDGLGLRPPIVMTLNLEPKEPRYVFGPCFIFIDALGLVHNYIVGCGALPHSHHGLLLPCFFSHRLKFKCGTDISS